MANTHPKSMPIKIECTRCGQTAMGLSGHLGKDHKNCVSGKPGTWKAV